MRSDLVRTGRRVNEQVLEVFMNMRSRRLERYVSWDSWNVDSVGLYLEPSMVTTMSPLLSRKVSTRCPYWTSEPLKS